MKFLNSSRNLFLLSFLVIILTNTFIFANIYINRFGDATSNVVLSERELTVPYNYNKENSSISLRIKYRVAGENTHQPYYNKKAYWLNEKKLQELGFDTKKYNKYKNQRSPLKKEVFIVLEQNAQAYKRSLRLAQEEFSNLDYKQKSNIKRKKENLRIEKEENSRLFVIDAGIDYAKLRQLYTDKTKYIIAKGTVRFSNYANINGYIDKLSISNVHVTLKHKNLLKNKNAKFKALIKYGSRYEPWISEIN
ncbi:MAG: DUF4824 family protein [Sulfurimonas sp.]|nr:DUF4824 family protein [Sulfurimonas sp.]